MTAPTIPNGIAPMTMSGWPYECSATARRPAIASSARRKPPRAPGSTAQVAGPPPTVEGEPAPGLPLNEEQEAVGMAPKPLWGGTATPG